MKDFIKLIKGHISAYFDFHESDLKHLLLFYSYGKGELSFLKSAEKIDCKEHFVLSYKSLSKACREDMPTKEELQDYENGIKYYALVSTSQIDIDLPCEEDCAEFDALNDLYNMLQAIPNKYIEENICLFLEFVHNTCYKKYIKAYLGLELDDSSEEEELIKTLRLLLNPKKGTVVHPLAELCNFITAIPDGISYLASYKNKAFANYWNFFSKIAGKEHVFHILNMTNGLSVAKNGYIIVDKIDIDEQMLWEIIKSTIDNNATGIFLIKQKSLFKYKKSIAQAYGCEAPLDILTYINYIIYLPNGLAILAVKNGKTRKDYVELFDATAESINCRKILEKFQKKESFKLSFDSFNKEDFTFDLNDIISKERESRSSGIKNRVYLKDIFLPREKLGIDIRKYHIQSCDHTTIDINEYSKYLPYYRYDEKQLKPILGKNAKKLKNRVLIVDLKNKKTFKPIILSFDTEEELTEFKLPNHCFLYRVNEDNIDFNFLINELNKTYFIEQIFPTSNDNINLKWEYILKCYIEFPYAQGCSTPIKRQRMHYNREIWTYLKTLLDSFDYNVDNFTSNKEHPLSNGSLIKNGRYRIEENLGAGGFGIVYKAFDTETRRNVAIKEFFDNKKQLRAKEDNNVFTPISHDLEEIMDACRMFMAEAIKIMGFENNNIVKIYDVFDDNDTCYYSMEYINGCDLEAYKKSKGCLKESEAIGIIKQVAVALKEMHNHKMCHYDISPENIMLDRENGHVVLVDFGSAKTSADESHVVYTKKLFSPTDELEKAFAAQGFYPKWDIYSLGATLYFITKENISTTKEQAQENTDSIITPKSAKDLVGQKETMIFERPTGMSDKTWKCIEKAVSKDRQKNIDEFLAMLPCE